MEEDPKFVHGKARVSDLVATVQNFYGLPIPKKPVRLRNQVPAKLKQRLEHKLNLGDANKLHDTDNSLSYIQVFFSKGIF
jgi:hypothetical protein